MCLSLKICRDVWGGWSVHGLATLPVAHLPSLSASIDYACNECAAAPATIELLIDGFMWSSIRSMGGRVGSLAPKSTARTRLLWDLRARHKINARFGG